MNGRCLTLLYLIIISRSTKPPEVTGTNGDWPLSNVELSLVISPNQTQHLHLKRTNRVLANEYLPVWVFKEIKDAGGTDLSFKLELEQGVMKQLGNFTFYQDPETNSAAVYFHRRKQLDGMIDTRYLIQGLSIDKINSTFASEIELETFGIINRLQPIDLWPHIPVSSEDFVDTVEYEVKKTYQNHLYDGYPEILVIVSCELSQDLQNKAKAAHKYNPIISHVLTLFNGVDMLYSKLKKTNIKLNIAGIAIDNECETHLLFEDCYGGMFDKAKQYGSTIINDDCIFEMIRRFLFQQRKVIPIDSYDVVVFLSGSHLIGMRNGKIPRLEGSTSYKPVYDMKKLDIFSIPVTAVLENGSSTNYAYIAHALAHSMNVNHDKEPFEEKQHCGNIMRLNEDYGQLDCVSWSDESEKDFQRFFSSTDCCGFINYPRSLSAERPNKMLTADEQCQCNGYKSAINLEEFSKEYCNSTLQCQNDNGQVHETLFPMNGTWCGIEKVCWQRNCTKIEDFKLHNL